MNPPHPQPTLRQAHNCESMLRAVAPDFDGVPIYITGLPPLYPNTRDRIAFTIEGGADPFIREHLQQQQRWRGPGINVVFCRELSDAESLASTLHEAVHKLPSVTPADAAEYSAQERAALLEHISERFSRDADPTIPAWFPYHSLPFIRRALHLHWRAWQAGFEPPLPLMSIAGEAYNLSPAWLYRRALGNEPERMARCSFATIEAEPWPAEFKRLFNSDFQAWCSQQATS